MSQSVFELADHVQSMLASSEAMTCTFDGEQSDFVRFNHAKIRQPGSVAQSYCTLRLIEGQRHASVEVTLSGDIPSDKALLTSELAKLRDLLPHLPEDPHLLIHESDVETHHSNEKDLPSSEQMTAEILDAAAGTDMVGILASGQIYSAFASSYGQRSWFSTRNFNLDWSLVHSADKAVKSGYAGQEWSSSQLQQKMRTAKSQLSRLALPSKSIEPGDYRVYLTPTALNEIISMVSWGGFGLQSHEAKVSPLLKLALGERNLSSKVTVSEASADGAAAPFQADGFLRPDRLELIKSGQFGSHLISPRSAREYGCETNGASGGEMPTSIDMKGGELALSNALSALDTGLYISNLWYLNYSDRSNAAMTGMTRFATFWVENGEIVAPLNVMRFDDTLYRILGSELEALTSERDFLLSASTYFQRSTQSSRLPGALIRQFRFTL